MGLETFMRCYGKIVKVWYCTWWSKILCAPDDYNTIVRCKETFWSPCRI